MYASASGKVGGKSHQVLGRLIHMYICIYVHTYICTYMCIRI